jgi:hypothetical protein
VSATSRLHVLESEAEQQNQHVKALQESLTRFRELCGQHQERFQSLSLETARQEQASEDAQKEKHLMSSLYSQLKVHYHQVVV